MNAKKFSDAMGELNNKYIEEAINYKRKRIKKVHSLIAACICLLLVIPLTAFAIDTIQYNAAVDYLNSLGIPVEDLNNYSREQIKEAAKTIEEPAQVTSEQIRQLTPTMTRKDVLSLLGDTQDIGSGIYIYVYEVDGKYLLRISFAGDDAQLGVAGEDLLKALTCK